VGDAVTGHGTGGLGRVGAGGRVKRWPFVLALVMLGGTWVLLASRSQAEAALPRRPFSEYPLRLGPFAGRDRAMDERVLDLLKLTDYVMRVYVPASTEPDAASTFAGQTRQAVAPVWLYVGYYGSQRTGATYHSPKNCLPGGGWVFRSSEPVSGVLPGLPAVAVNRVVIEKGFERQLILYWYQDRGRVIASEYAAKGYLILDATTRNRTDGALVRVSTPVVGSEEEAFRHAVAFVREAFPALGEHLPG
jgi:EpsI family protein